MNDFKREIMEVIGERKVHRGSDFNPTPGRQIRFKLSCGHVTRWFPASRAPKIKTKCVFCQ